MTTAHIVESPVALNILPGFVEFKKTEQATSSLPFTKRLCWFLPAGQLTSSCVSEAAMRPTADDCGYLAQPLGVNLAYCVKVKQLGNSMRA